MPGGSGAASEPAVAFTAAGSVVLFVCVFTRILLSVPQHWGVPYKDRLARHLSRSSQGFVVEMLQAAFSIASCVLFVMETYDSNGQDYRFIVRAFSLELAFNGFFLCNFMLHLYLAVDKCSHLLSLQAIVDIVTVPPAYAVLFINDGLRNSTGERFSNVYLGLKVTRVIRVARLLVAISFFLQGQSLAFDHSRQILVLRAQFVRRGLQTLVAIFIMAGLVNFLVEVQNSDWGAGYGVMPFHDALYYIVVSFSTVGYGDISPSTPLSRMLIAVLILSLVFCAPLVTNVLVNLVRLTPKHGGRLSKAWGTGHIVVGCDSSCLRVVSVLLRELLAPDSMSFHTAHVVVVVPEEPTLAWEALLCLQPAFAVTYLNGDLRSAEDQRRARVGDARACFVLSDRLALDTNAQDNTALVRALCAHQATPPGASVLCLMTHAKSKRRLVRLGVPAASVVCYDNVMDALVAQACLHAGFSTIWSNTLSCMPETDLLLKARSAEHAMLRSPTAMLVYETEIEYLLSLQRVMIRFHLDAFAGEYAGDVAVELYQECECTLFALMWNTCSGGHKGANTCADGHPEELYARVHPDYSTVLRGDDVGVFIGANHRAGDRIARYCAARTPPGRNREEQALPPSKASASSRFGRIARYWQFFRSGRRAGGGPSQGRWHGKVREGQREREQKQQQQHRRRRQGVSNPAPTLDVANVQDQPQSNSVQAAPFHERSRTSEKAIWSQVDRDGRLAESISPLDERLSGIPPGRVVVITQSLSFALGVVLALCDAEVDFKDGQSSVTVLCPPTWWDPTVDEVAERKLTARFPSVQLRKMVAECDGLIECGCDTADLVCIVSSRVSEHEWEPFPFQRADPGGEGPSHSGRGQGSDGWAMSVLVDVLGLAPVSTRVVVRFDDSDSAQQHQVITAHVRRRAALREQGRGAKWLTDYRALEEKEHEVDEEDEAPTQVSPSNENSSPRTISSHVVRRERGLRGDSCASVAGVASGVYFDDTRGVVHEGFDDFFATTSGYASGDVVIGNAAELLLLQAMLAPDIQSLMSDVLNLASRIPIEILWPEDSIDNGSGEHHRPRPETYGEAYRSLLQDRNMLALGLHRPPPRTREASGDSTSGPSGHPSCRAKTEGAATAAATDKRGEDPTSAGADEPRRCFGASRYVSIACPSSGFPLLDGDCVFVLRRPSQTGSST